MMREKISSRDSPLAFGELSTKYNCTLSQTTQCQNYDSVESSKESVVVRFCLQKVSLAKISFVILAVATVTEHVWIRMSPDVNRPKASLGSAAISTVTNTLSPILPFTGGVDLRREDYWASSGSLWEKIVSFAYQVHEAFAEATHEATSVDFELNTENLESQLTNKTFTQKHTPIKYTLALSSNDPYVAVKDIAELTIGEVGAVLRYSAESNRDGFDRASFMQGNLPRVRKVIEALDVAVSTSRGYGVIECKQSTLSGNYHGSINALKFVGAMRVFAEWRIPRQVPDGYKGFAVGMNLGYKDVVQNLVKIEQAVHMWLDYQKRLSSDVVCSPTLFEVLQHEKIIGMHTNLPRLREKSGAMGLLWVRRQLQYQTKIFANFLQVPSIFPSTEAGVSDAYSKVYDQYHGWAVQKIFSYSFHAAPKAEEIFKQMNPHKLKELSNSGPQAARSRPTRPSTRSPENYNVAIGSNPVEIFMKKAEFEWNKAINHVINEWEKFSSSISRELDNVITTVDKVLHLEHDRDPSRIDNDKNAATEHERFIVQEMTKDARHEISLFLHDVNPLLDNLAKFFVSMNMDDPTRV